MKKYSKLIGLLALVGAIGCQKPAEFDGTLIGAEEQTGTTIVNNLCTDGTLNCIIDENEFNSQSSILNQLYQQCYDGCMEEAGAVAGTCEDACNDILDTPSDAWESDELRIPDNAMALEVTIEACVDTSMNNTLKLSGPVMSFANYTTPESQAMGAATGTSLIGVGARGAPIGLNLKCKVEDLYNKIKVKYHAVDGSSVQIKNAPHTVIPFTGVSDVQRTYRSPHVAEWGIPKQFRDRMNTGQHAWLLKKAKGPADISTVVQFQHQNNDMGPLSLVHIFPPLHWMKMKFELVFFAPAQ